MNILYEVVEAPSLQQLAESLNTKYYKQVQRPQVRVVYVERTERQAKYAVASYEHVYVALVEVTYVETIDTEGK